MWQQKPVHGALLSRVRVVRFHSLLSLSLIAVVVVSLLACFPASNIADSIRLAMTDGESDIDDGNTYKEHLIDALEAGRGMNMSTIRRALFNTFRIRFRLGLFDPPSTHREWWR